MPGKRGANTKKDIINKILLIKKTDQFNKLKPKTIRNILMTCHKSSLVPSERVIYEIIKKNKDKIVFDPIDGPWTLASLDTYPVPPEVLPKVLMIWQKVLKENQIYLTNRMVKWIVRLHGAIKDIDKLMETVWEFSVSEAMDESLGSFSMSNFDKIEGLLKDRISSKCSGILSMAAYKTIIDIGRDTKEESE